MYEKTPYLIIASFVVLFLGGELTAHANLIVDANPVSNTNRGANLGSADGNNLIVGQCFTGNGQKLVSADFWAQRIGGTSGNAVAKIFAIAGNYGTTCVAMGNPLATSSGEDTTNFPTYSGENANNFGKIEFSFIGDNQIVLIKDVHYLVGMEYVGVPGGLLYYAENVIDGVKNNNDILNDTHSGNRGASPDETVGSWYSESQTDMIFQVNGRDLPTPTPVPTHVYQNVVSSSAKVFIAPEFGGILKLTVSVLSIAGFAILIFNHFKKGKQK
jgi:hypothetical protein